PLRHARFGRQLFLCVVGADLVAGRLVSPRSRRSAYEGLRNRPRHPAWSSRRFLIGASSLHNLYLQSRRSLAHRGRGARCELLESARSVIGCRVPTAAGLPMISRSGGVMRYRVLAVAMVATLVWCGAAVAADPAITSVSYPERQSTSLVFAKTGAAPEKAELKGSVRYENGQARVSLSFSKMEPA